MTQSLCHRTASLIVAFAMAMTAAFSGPADAQTRAIRLSAPVEIGTLSREEVRTVQAALALTGNYTSLLDGAWGRGSQGALDRYVRDASGNRTPTWRDLRGLLRRWEAERVAGGWRGVWHADVSVWHLRPDAMLRREETADESRFIAEDGGLVLLSRRDTDRPIALIDAFEQDARPGTAPYRLVTDDRVVLAAQMRGGRHVYVRSDRAGRQWATHIVLADDANRNRLQLIASSFARSQRGDVDPNRHATTRALLGSAGNAPLPAPQSPAPQPAPQPQASGSDLRDQLIATLLGTVLDQVLDQEEAAAPPVQAPAPQQPPQRAELRRATGFFVNTTDIATSAALARSCNRVRIDDGTRLRQLFVDRAVGVAIYVAPGRSPDWLPLARGVPERGAAIVTLETRRNGGALRVADGFIARDRADRGILRHDARLPGRDAVGAPVLDLGGHVVGMNLPTGDRAARARAASVDAMAETLSQNGVPFADSTGLPSDLAAEVPHRFRRALVNLECAD